MSGPPFKDRFSASCPTLSQYLRAKISEDVDYTQPDKNKPICLKMYSVFSICLPPLQAFPEEFKHWYNISVLDLDMKDDLQRAKVINWCRTAKKLYPIKTTADGNCLLHAISLALWGIEDDNQFLRRLVYIALAEDSTGCFQRRWLLQLRQVNQERPRDFNFQINSADWKREWESVITAALDLPTSGTGLAYATLESIHLYVIANVLKRPVILLAENRARTVHGQSIQENNLQGIYLPLEWDHTDTCKCPLIIGYNLNHFAPLVSQENMPNGRAIDGEYVVPLINADHTQLPLKFLLAHEEPVAHELLNQYLKIRNVPMTLTDSIMQVPAAKTEHQCIHDGDNIVTTHRLDCERIYRQWVQQEFGHTVNPNVTSPSSESGRNILPQSQNPGLQHSEANPKFWPYTKCVTPGCEMFGSPSTANMCSKCLEDYTVKFNRDEMARKGQEEVHFNFGPSAPPPSIQPEPSGVFLSMLGELCHNKCGLKCSVNTYPYCHECASKVRRIDSEPRAPEQGIREQLQPNKQENQHLPLTQPLLQQAELCKNELCMSPSAEGCDNYCRQCFDKMDEKLFGEGENLHSLILIPPNNTSSESPVNFDKDVKNVTTTSLSSEQCTSPNCKGKVIRGKCARCIIKSGSRDSLLHSGSSGDPASETYVMRVPSVPEAPVGVPSSVPINSPSPPEAYQFYKCKNKTCKNFGEFSGYCRTCYTANSASGGHQPSTSSNQTASVQKHLCPTPGCEGVRLELSPYCLKCTKSYNKDRPENIGQVTSPVEGGNSPESEPLESRTPSSAFALAAAAPIITSSKQKVNCASPLCKTLIYPPKRLCDKCTEILRINHAMSKLEASSQEEKRSRSLELNRNSPVKHGPSYSPSRQKCLRKECTFYGDKKFNGYCSQCFQKGKSSTSAMAALRPTPQLTNMRPKTVPFVERERPRNCVEPGCDRFGDPNMFYRCTEHFTLSQQVFVPAYPPDQQNQRIPIRGNSDQFNVSEQEQVQIMPAPPGWLQQPSPMPQVQNMPIRQQDRIAPVSQDEGYVQAMAKVEGARKHVSVCKTNGCHNYGNSRNDGYCNSCYIQVQKDRLKNPPRDEYQCC